MASGRRLLAGVAIQLVLAFGVVCLCSHHDAPATGAEHTGCAAHSGEPAPAPADHAPACPHCRGQAAVFAVAKADLDGAPAHLPLLGLRSVEASSERDVVRPLSLAPSPPGCSARVRLAHHRVLLI